MKKNLYLTWLSLVIEWNWIHIHRYRKRANRMIRQGVPVTSAPFLLLDRKLSRHALSAMVNKRRYEDGCGLTDQLQIQNAPQSSTSPMAS